MLDVGLRDELLRRMDRDQKVRTAVPRGEPWPEAVREECRAVDADTTEFLKSVIAECGWPGHDLVVSMPLTPHGCWSSTLITTGGSSTAA